MTFIVKHSNRSPGETPGESSPERLAGYTQRAITGLALIAIAVTFTSARSDQNPTYPFAGVIISSVVMLFEAALAIGALSLQKKSIRRSIVGPGFVFLLFGLFLGIIRPTGGPSYVAVHAAWLIAAGVLLFVIAGVSGLSALLDWVRSR